MKTLDATGYDTDKGAGYLSTYETLFGHLRDEPVRLLELGIHNGGSLLLWRDYFQKGMIAGLDVNAVRLEDFTGRIRTYKGLQEDCATLDAIARDCGPFDIVIDDASHIAQFARVSFWHLFKRHLKPGGIYVIEDWGTGYWDAWPDGHHYESPVETDSAGGAAPALPRASHNYGMVGFVKELIDECAMEDITKPGLGVSPHRESLIEKVQMSFGQAAVIKRNR